MACKSMNIWNENRKLFEINTILMKITFKKMYKNKFIKLRKILFCNVHVSKFYYEIVFPLYMHLLLYEKTNSCYEKTLLLGLMEAIIELKLKQIYNKRDLVRNFSYIFFIIHLRNSTKKVFLREYCAIIWLLYNSLLSLNNDLLSTIHSYFFAQKFDKNHKLPFFRLFLEEM